ncbi:MAG: ABC transporter permease [Acidimicrobiia bacterium]|nr:ABC transporter permease [Acidimicrobiia bacterium]
MTNVATTTPYENPALDGSGAIRSSWIFVQRSMKHSLRDVESLLMAILLPVMLMLIFTYVFGGAMSVGLTGSTSAYLGYVVPGIILTCAGFGASSTGVAVSMDMTTGTINRLRTMPIVSATVLVGHTVASLMRNLVATATVVLVAVVLGFQPEANLWEWLGVAGVIASWILAITTLFAMLGLVAQSPAAASGYGFILLFLPYVSSAFAPIETMPEWLQGFARNQPVTSVIEATRALLGGGSPESHLVVAFLWTIGIVLVALGLILWIFPKRVAR